MSTKNLSTESIQIPVQVSPIRSTRSNRLNLDWSLNSRAERASFLNLYLKGIPFTPTESEIEMMSKYFYWGAKDSLRTEGIELESSSGIWDTPNLDSLDSLIESPTFNESSVHSLHSVQPKIPKLNFDRVEARRKAPSYILDVFEELWRQIDSTELLVTQYELFHGKRTKEIRPSLLSRFSALDIDASAAKASTLTEFQYLKKRHLLVELRRDQYSLRDSYTETIQVQEEPHFEENFNVVLGEDVDVLPLGLPYDSKLSSKLFCADHYPFPSQFNESELEQISKILWKKNDHKLQIDFRNEDHVYKIIEMLGELETYVKSGIEDIESTLDEFCRLVRAYIGLAKLKDFQRDILEKKIQKKSNLEIQKDINEKYGKKYSLNYISTVYCKSIIPEIAAAASKHREVVESLFFPEEFKKCIDCGGSFLRNNDNFVKKARSSDGFSPRCKCCEKKLREKRSK